MGPSVEDALCKGSAVEKNLMRKILFGAAFSSALIAAPALAQEGRFYVGGELGALVSSETDQTYTPGAAPGSAGAISTEHDLGFSGAAFAGYDFGPIRVELEASYFSVDVDEVSSSFAAGGGLIVGSQGASGDVSARAVMANGAWDIGGPAGLTFFVGGGVGLAQVKVSGLTTSGGAVLLDDEDDDWLFAWQVSGGVRKALTSNLDAHVRYRYFNVDDADMIGLSGRVVAADFSAHALSVGLSLNF